MAAAQPCRCRRLCRTQMKLKAVHISDMPTSLYRVPPGCMPVTLTLGNRSITAVATSFSAVMSLQSALAFPEMSLHFSSIARAQVQTCGWIFEAPEFKRRRDPEYRHVHHGILWIKGKPGAGNSTIMKFLTNGHQEDVKKRGKPISFFFQC